jgi:glycosyltransferase involved in cell wall biosynthesis
VPIKTLHLTNAFHPASGGIRTFYRAMLAAANAERRYMRLVVPAEESRIEEVGDYGRIYHVRAPRSPWVDTRYRLILPQMFLSPRGEVRRILAEEQPDLVEVCDKYSLCYAAGALRRGWLNGTRRPTIVGLSCERLDDNVWASMSAGRLAQRFARWYIGRIYTGQFDVHLANSEYTARELREHQVTKHRREVHVVPMGVTVDDLGPWRKSADLREELHRQIGSNSEATLLLYAGRLSPEKNLSLLIEMMARLGSAAGNVAATRLIIAGDGPSAAALRQEAERRAPGRVLFYGHVGARETLARLYASCDVFVHPNPREPFGIGPLEAMASGVPLVAPAAGGLLSYANDTNAWLAEPTGEAFARAVRAACQPGPDRDGRLTRARETAAGYTWPNVTRTIFELYDRLHNNPVVPSRVVSRHVDAICP